MYVYYSWQCWWIRCVCQSAWDLTCLSTLSSLQNRPSSEMVVCVARFTANWLPVFNLIKPFLYIIIYNFMHWLFLPLVNMLNNNVAFWLLRLSCNHKIHVLFLADATRWDRPSPRPRGSARRKTASSLILRGHF